MMASGVVLIVREDGTILTVTNRNHGGFGLPGGKCEDGEDPKIASVDTLRHRKKPAANFLLTDESQRDASDGRRKLRALYGDAFKLGLSATPCRLDKRGLRADYEDLISISSPTQLIADGYLASPRVFTVPEEDLPDVSLVRVSRGDFSVGELDRVTNKANLIGNIVEHWVKLAEGRRTIVFAVQHPRGLRRTLRFAGARLGGGDHSSPRVRDLEKMWIRTTTPTGRSCSRTRPAIGAQETR